MSTPAQTFLRHPGPEKHAAVSRISVRVLGLGAALVILTGSWLGHWCRTAEGFLNGRFAAGLAGAAALAVVSLTARSRWERSGQWLALALAGQAAALQLIDAGNLIHYQHYRLPLQAFADPVVRWALLLALLQAILGFAQQ